MSPRSAAVLALRRQCPPSLPALTHCCPATLAPACVLTCAHASACPAPPARGVPGASHPRSSLRSPAHPRDWSPPPQIAGSARAAPRPLQRVLLLCSGPAAQAPRACKPSRAASPYTLGRPHATPQARQAVRTCALNVAARARAAHLAREARYSFRLTIRLCWGLGLRARGPLGVRRRRALQLVLACPEVP